MVIFREILLEMQKLYFFTTFQVQCVDCTEFDLYSSNCDSFEKAI